ncbi:uncharacterized protein BO66DRAFT_445697 [Aspergillus aculeatinus CBS 121060]|uniref:Uncharacterized protein n=1 Tax=Aspergillus aculeatinus CBS 121060 TaxID=1448322 RepID=A0ACD1HQ55_9EURO|nr:hypothetical protein BO66DRAFT_445697 [Aspergillus aculeatinus CBS 121060]RAH75646.1 hypothetical protein BO66DRAFT_445697 [Aspergillus aculeatinus CBS 121060]
MDSVQKGLPDVSTENPQLTLEHILSSEPITKHLDILTNILRQGRTVDERISALIHAAWEHVRREELWSSRFDSLDEYRHFIGFEEHVKPVLRRHKRSDRSKQLSARMIAQHWDSPFHLVLPASLRPPFWSKHLLNSLASLSRLKPLPEAVHLLQESVKKRPRRGRTQPHLLASDIERVLEAMRVPRQGRRGRKNSVISIDSILTGHESPTTTLVGSDSHENGASPQGPSTMVSEKSFLDDQTQCPCSPMLFPLLAILAESKAQWTSHFLARLLQWASRMSWESLCTNHLQQLYRHATQSDGLDLDRSLMSQDLEKLSSTLNGEEASMPDDFPDFLPTPAAGKQERPIPNAFKSFVKDEPSLWSSLQQNGYLHIPGFFAYMETRGIFPRVRHTLARYASDDQGQVLSQKCYQFLRQMIQQDPAYYAVVASCRPDGQWRLLNRSLDSASTWVAGGMLSVPGSVQRESDIQSTVMLPTFCEEHCVNLVPGSHTMFAPPSHNNEYSPAGVIEIGKPSSIRMRPGDLLLTMPHLLRFPQTFASHALVNLSQDAADLRGNTTRWSHQLSTSALAQPSDAPGADECSVDIVSAIGEALAGRRAWSDRKVLHQQTILSGLDTAAATSFVDKVRERLVLEFHEALDIVEISHAESAAALAADVLLSDVSTETDWAATELGMSTLLNVEPLWLPESFDHMSLQDLGFDALGEIDLFPTLD